MEKVALFVFLAINSVFGFVFPTENAEREIKNTQVIQETSKNVELNDVKSVNTVEIHKGSPYSISNGKVYYTSDAMGGPYTNPVEGGDPDTFTVFTTIDGYNSLEEGLFQSDEEFSDFMMRNEFAKDKKYVYFKGEKIEGADASTFTVQKNSWYFKDKNRVYIVIANEKNSYISVLEKSDPATFEEIPSNIYGNLGLYSKDKNRVFLTDKEIIGADPSTFAVVYADKDYRFSPVYSKDKSFVYLYEKRVPNLVPDTTRLINADYPQFISDGNRVYYVLTDGYSFERSILEEFTGIDVKTFSILSNIFVKDKNAVYVIDYRSTYDIRKNSSKKWLHVIAGADPLTFEVLDVASMSIDEDNPAGKVHSNYGKDKNNIYFLSDTVVGADRDTFKPLWTASYRGSQPDAEDKKYKYEKGKVWNK